MAYIRNSNNPEAIYIWAGADGNVTIMKGPDTVGIIPTKIFNGLIKKYIKKGCPDDCKHKKAKIEEVWLPVPSDRITDNMKMLSMMSSPMVRLSYGDWHIDMWGVTWYYIAHSNTKK